VLSSILKPNLRDILIVYFYSKTKLIRENFVLKSVKHIYIYIYIYIYIHIYMDHKHCTSVIFVDIKRPNVLNVYADIYTLKGLIRILIVERPFCKSESLGCSIYRVYLHIFHNE